MGTRSITAAVPMGPRLSEDPAKLVPELTEVSAALFKAVGNGSVPRTTISLVHLRAGQIVRNTYLTVLHTGFLRKAGAPEEQITSVASWQDSPYFDAAERAALALVEAVLQPSAHGERVPDERPRPRFGGRGRPLPCPATRPRAPGTPGSSARRSCPAGAGPSRGGGPRRVRTSRTRASYATPPSPCPTPAA